jgi:hypothetical protein
MARYRASMPSALAVHRVRESFYKLTPRAGRLEVLTQACLDCDNDLHASQGPGWAATLRRPCGYRED